MQIHLSTDGVPIYQQIVDQIRQRIVSGQLRSGDELPAIRVLAESLQVNPNTIARAYRELEHQSLVEKRRTTGTFVAELTPRQSIAERRRMLSPAIEGVVIQARQLGITIDDVLELIKKRDQQLSRETKR